MAPRADLTGQVVESGGTTWRVDFKAPAQKRIPMWTCVHLSLGREEPGVFCEPVDLPHVALVKALAGKGGLPRCAYCEPAGPNIDHGLHLACGAAHLIGTPCPDGAQREPGWTVIEPVRVEPVRVETVVNGDTVTTTSHFDWSDFDDEPSEPLAPAAVFAAVDIITSRMVASGLPIYSGHPADALPGSAYQKAKAAACASSDTTGASGPSPASATPNGASSCNSEPAPAATAPSPSTADVVHGRVDRLEEPQAILDVIRGAMHGRARNHQSQPGPSQIGGCERKLGYHLAFGSGNGARDDSAWRPEVGTAVHAWLDEMFARAGREQGRWLSDVEVTAPIAGRLDLFDTVGNEVIDFKVSGKATRDKAARGEISEKYEVQLDLYGLGMMVKGYTVARVALLFLPPAGSLADSVWYSRPFDLNRALAAVAKRDRVVDLLIYADPADVLERLSTTEDFCATCPALGQYCKGAQTAWIPSGLPDSAWPAYDAAVKAAS